MYCPLMTTHHEHYLFHPKSYWILVANSSGLVYRRCRDQIYRTLVVNNLKAEPGNLTPPNDTNVTKNELRISHYKDALHAALRKRTTSGTTSIRLNIRHQERPCSPLT